MIVLDLEWNRGYDKKPLDEVLQIGAVRMDWAGPLRIRSTPISGPASISASTTSPRSCRSLRPFWPRN